MMVTLPKVDRDSYDYQAMIEAGFAIKEPFLTDRVLTHQGNYLVGEFESIRIMCPFICVCGREEWFVKWFAEAHEMKYFFPEGKWNVAAEIINAGATSEAHLRNDGFAEEDIRRIRKVFDDYEKKQDMEAADRFWADVEKYGRYTEAA